MRVMEKMDAQKMDNISSSATGSLHDLEEVSSPLCLHIMKKSRGKPLFHWGRQKIPLINYALLNATIAEMNENKQQHLSYFNRWSSV